VLRRPPRRPRVGRRVGRHGAPPRTVVNDERRRCLWQGKEAVAGWPPATRGVSTPLTQPAAGWERSVEPGHGKAGKGTPPSWSRPGATPCRPAYTGWSAPLRGRLEDVDA